MSVPIAGIADTADSKMLNYLRAAGLPEIIEQSRAAELELVIQQLEAMIDQMAE